MIGILGVPQHPATVLWDNNSLSNIFNITSVLISETLQNLKVYESKIYFQKYIFMLLNIVILL